MYIYPYKKGSRSVRALSKKLGIKILKTSSSKFKDSPNKIVINWGASQTDQPIGYKGKLLNKPDKVAVATNKLTFFQLMADVKNLTPKYTTNKQDAQVWIQRGWKVVCRSVLNGHSGRGITIARTIDELVDAPLYVHYRKKQDEYRVHVFNGEVIDVQRKARRLDVPDNQVNWYVRNHANGFIYARDNVDAEHIPYWQELINKALLCIKKTELDFGAVDLIYNQKANTVYVLEVNTAPGLEGTTLDRYVNAIRRIK